MLPFLNRWLTSKPVLEGTVLYLWKKKLMDSFYFSHMISWTLCLDPESMFPEYSQHQNNTKEMKNFWQQKLGNAGYHKRCGHYGRHLLNIKTSNMQIFAYYSVSWEYWRKLYMKGIVFRKMKSPKFTILEKINVVNPIF